VPDLLNEPCQIDFYINISCLQRTAGIAEGAALFGWPNSLLENTGNLLNSMDRFGVGRTKHRAPAIVHEISLTNTPS
jgi:hypothetical protein